MIAMQYSEILILETEKEYEITYKDSIIEHLTFLSFLKQSYIVLNPFYGHMNLVCQPNLQ